ncbi:hypothetical protein AB0O76_34655 [Streptomyces sp. NPDC086554]|uniref:RNA polymerase sigma factor n=1 Tax=Streptomyces sp. NPDC086554 TaxID=3154864 RepID=UPI0034459F79
MSRLGVAVRGRLVEPYRLALDRYRTRPPTGGDSEIVTQVHRGDVRAFDVIVERHWAAVAAYLCTCTADLESVDDLTERTFSHAFVEAAQGAAPTFPWRVHLLATARGLVLREWVHRPVGPFLPGFRRWASAGGAWPLNCRPHLAEAYRTLPESRQAVLWHSIVEGDISGSATACLGARRGDFDRLASRARVALRESYLELRQRAAVLSVECTKYSALLAAAVAGGPTDPDAERGRADECIADHLAVCGRCREVYGDLADLDEQVRTQLPPLLLGWWPGPEYHRLRASQSPPGRPLAFLREAAARAAASASG